ncbi:MULTISPECIES: acyl-CoA dehydrogenase family protein [unclassified Sphingobium]|uniref:acyl-CoA dehydrogenase family protein n=1 Tax=unclassified Sphingobium TaxID=2611147 RepID=UPI0035A5818E
MSDDMISMLTDQAGRLFGDLIDRDLLAGAEAGKAPAALADAVEAFGLADALTVPAEDGGLSFADAGTLFALLGYHAVPLPIGETMLARMLLARTGINAPDGDIALGDRSVGSTSAAAHVLLREAGQLLLLPAATQEVSSISRAPRWAIDANVEPVANAAWPADMPDALTLGAMLRASQIAGGVARALQMTIDYANERKQFGKPIGRFQAIQQQLAALAAEAAAARSAADAAWAALDGGSLGLMAAVAKIRAGQAARLACAIAHQVHGAIGVTDEHMLHYITRRLWEWRTDFGTDAHWATLLGRAAREAEQGLWHFITAGCPATQKIEEPA